MSLELFLAYANTKDIKVRNTLVKLNLNLARKVAHDMEKVCAEPYEDLEQEATIGLIKAIEMFDPKRLVAFSSYAMPYMRGKLLQYLRDKGHLIRLSQSIQTLNNKGKKIARELAQELGRTPSLSEVASKLGCKTEDYRFAVQAEGAATKFELLEETTTLIANENGTLEYSIPVKDVDWESLTENELATLSKKGGRRQVWLELGQLNEKAVNKK